MAKGYRPTDEVIERLRGLYISEGKNYAATARALNRSRRSGGISPAQVKSLLNQRWDTSGENPVLVNDPARVRFSEADKRSLQRNTEYTGREQQRAFKQFRESDAYGENAEKILANIRRKRAKLKEAAKLNAVLDPDLYERQQKQIARLNQFEENVIEAREAAENAEEYRGISDLTTP